MKDPTQSTPITNGSRQPGVSPAHGRTEPAAGRAAALVDRSPRHAHIVQVSAESYLLKAERKAGARKGVAKSA